MLPIGRRLCACGTTTSSCLCEEQRDAAISTSENPVFYHSYRSKTEIAATGVRTGFAMTIGGCPGRRQRTLTVLHAITYYFPKMPRKINEKREVRGKK